MTCMGDGNRRTCRGDGNRRTYRGDGNRRYSVNRKDGNWKDLGAYGNVGTLDIPAGSVGSVGRMGMGVGRIGDPGRPINCLGKIPEPIGSSVPKLGVTSLNDSGGGRLVAMGINGKSGPSGKKVESIGRLAIGVDGTFGSVNNKLVSIGGRLVETAR